MQHFFAVPWLIPSRRTLHGIAVVAFLVFGFFAILKSTSGGGEAPPKELVTGSIPRAASVPKPPPPHPTMAPFQPASTPLSTPLPNHHAAKSQGGGRRRCPVAGPGPKRVVPPVGGGGGKPPFVDAPPRRSYDRS